MIQLVLFLFVIVAMVKIAAHEGLSPLMWGLVTFGICFLCMLIPLPFLNVLIAFGLSFIAMTAYNAVRGPR